jgi:hypothetical protein
VPVRVNNRRWTGAQRFCSSLARLERERKRSQRKARSANPAAKGRFTDYRAEATWLAKAFVRLQFSRVAAAITAVRFWRPIIFDHRRQVDLWRKNLVQITRLTALERIWRGCAVSGAP